MLLVRAIGAAEDVVAAPRGAEDEDVVVRRPWSRRFTKEPLFRREGLYGQRTCTWDTPKTGTPPRRTVADGFYSVGLLVDYLLWWMWSTSRPADTRQPRIGHGNGPGTGSRSHFATAPGQLLRR